MLANDVSVSVNQCAVNNMTTLFDGGCCKWSRNAWSQLYACPLRLKTNNTLLSCHEKLTKRNQYYYHCSAGMGAAPVLKLVETAAWCEVKS